MNTPTTAASSTDKRLTEADLSPDQREAYDAIRDWITSKHGGILTCGGIAGSGKTSLLGVLANRLAAERRLVAYVAYTGRASSVLGRKLRASGTVVTDKMNTDNDRILNGRFGHLFASYGKRGGPAFCGTIHKMLYRPLINAETEELLGWRRREELDRAYDLLIADEASMISDEMLRDLESYGTPILAVGDHGQLPPVMASGALMQNPMLRLEKIHRQAEGNPIIALAAHVREGGWLREFADARGARRGDTKLVRGADTDARVVFRAKTDLAHVLKDAYANRSLGAELLDVGVLCYTNRNRVMLNGAVRRALASDGRVDPKRAPQRGEVMICLKNAAPVFNGMRGVLTSDTWTADDVADREEATRAHCNCDPSPSGGCCAGPKHCSCECNTCRPPELFEDDGFDAPDGDEQPTMPWHLGADIEFPEEGLAAQRFILNVAQINREKPFADVEELRRNGIDVRRFSEAGHPADFGYCMTIHRSQGSSFRHVVLYVDMRENPNDDTWRRLIYTAVTRASDKLTVLQ